MNLMKKIKNYFMNTRDLKKLKEEFNFKYK